LRILISTFGPGDAGKVLQAMAALPYDQLILVAERPGEECDGLERIARLEDLIGRSVGFERIVSTEFMHVVDEICEVLDTHSKDTRTGARNDLLLNISGGSKILGDAALFAAFRLGVAAYHCDGRITRLPVIHGATAVDRFTKLQSKLLVAIGDGATLPEVVDRMQPSGKQAAERVIRELRKQGLLASEIVPGKVRLVLTSQGAEAARAIRAAGQLVSS
jgi:hypothetical protein